MVAGTSGIHKHSNSLGLATSHHLQLYHIITFDVMKLHDTNSQIDWVLFIFAQPAVDRMVENLLDGFHVIEIAYGVNDPQKTSIECGKTFD